MAKSSPLQPLRTELRDQYEQLIVALRYVEEVAPDHYRAGENHRAHLFEKMEQWQQHADQWEAENLRLFGKKNDPADLISDAENLVADIKGLAYLATQEAKKPALVSAAMSSAKSRIAAAEVTMPTLQEMGADPAPALASIAELRELLSRAAELLARGDYEAAASAAEALDAVGRRLSVEVRDQNTWVSTLNDDIDTARSLAKSVNSQASETAELAQAVCTPHPQTRSKMDRCNTLFSQALAELEEATGKPVPVAATTLVYSATQKLKEAETTLREVAELEQARNDAFELVTTTNSDLADALAASTLTTSDLWETLDQINALLAAGDVFAAAAQQAELVEAASARLRPALTSAPNPERVRGPAATLNRQTAAELDRAGAREPAQLNPPERLALPAAVADVQDSEALDPHAHLADLRNLVRHLAGEVASLKADNHE